jgi:hypothetical protein
LERRKRHFLPTAYATSSVIDDSKFDFDEAIADAYAIWHLLGPHGSLWSKKSAQTDDMQPRINAIFP